MSENNLEHHMVPSRHIMEARPGQERYISEVDETGLGAVDAVEDESAPSSMWGEAWKYLRKRVLFWVASAIILLVIVMALFPSLFTSQDPSYGELARSMGNPRPAIRLVLISRATTFTRVSFMVHGPRLQWAS